MSGIVVSELEYAPPGADALFFDISFGVSPGDHAAIVGANGAGKSTILRILGRDIEPDAGEFAVNGTVLTMTQDVGATSAVTSSSLRGRLRLNAASNRRSTTSTLARSASSPEANANALCLTFF